MNHARFDVAALQRQHGALNEYLGAYAKLFSQQMRFCADSSKRKAALCSRRAGKSHSAATYLVETARRHPESICVYIALTRLSAKRLLWPVLKRLNNALNLNLAFNSTELTAQFENGSQIWLAGADDEAQIEKLRGSAYHLAIIDEAASFGAHLEALVDEVLDPALLDYNGTLCMIGTPGAACVGKFYDVTTRKNSGWSVHRWTVLDNPHLPNASDWLARKRQDNRWEKDNPVYRREWLGQWVRDDSSLVYHYDGDNLFDAELPRGLVHVLGIDLGFNDQTAFSMASSSYRDPVCYIHDGAKFPRLDVTAVANKAKEYMAKWECHRIVVDCGGLGRMIAEELNLRHNIPCQAAEKTDKLGAIELLNADLLSKRVKIQRDHPALAEWDILQWDEDRKKEDPRYPNDISDACLYSYREAKHWSYLAPVEKPAIDSPEYWKAEEDELEAFNTTANDDTYEQFIQ